MAESVGWNWNVVTDSYWLNPCEESYYYAVNWKKEGCESVLDLGCGLGRHSILFAKSGYKVTACDISKDAVDHLKKWKKEENLNIRSVLADMKSLPFADNAFDCIFSYHVISHTDTEGFAGIMNEIRRVLRPNGKIFFTLCSKDAWSFTEGNFPKIDENSILKTEGAEVNVPHFYVNRDDILRLLPDFKIRTIRHIDDCYHDGAYGKGRHYYISAVLNKDFVEPDYSSIIGKEVSGHIDRPLGTSHPRHPNIVYPVNYGYVDGIFAGDGAEQDIYLLNETKPVEEFTGKVIAVYHRFNDVEDKWIVTEDGSDVPDEEILKQIEFQEKYFDGKLYR
ncbi:methyltransferase domain-containing protein [Treponema sp.]|uniref:methyltransferase domain-containing protein n=1 Tax=Treponema sp. TaxID=166 RepID=UPI00298E0F5A|nr:methyltransferase domain-containing protein [Treponema sp.]MCQ2242339.1 methyltransferase domain-containing protein [Treponema sp.]